MSVPPTDPVTNSAIKGQLTIVDLFTAAERFQKAGDRPGAIELYRQWLAATPSPVAYAAQFNMAVLLADGGDLAGAEAGYRAAVEQHPRFGQGWLNLGTLLERLGRPAEALTAWRTIVDYASPKKLDEREHLLLAINNIGRLLEIMKDYPGAEEVLTRSLRLDPEQPKVITHWIHLRQKQCKWPVFDSQAIGIPADKLLEHTSALAMLSASDNPARQLAAARTLINERVTPNLPHLAAPKGYTHERLRIGYLSSDFCSHAVSILTAELYGLHDRSRVEVYGFSWTKEDGSPLRARVVQGMDHYIRIDAMTDEEAAQCIRAYEIDVLVDLHGLTLGARPDILAYRPAPVQLTWLGFPGSTAQPDIDYVIADEFVLPPQLAPYFTEKPLYLPGTFQINDRQRLIGTCPTKEQVGLPADAVVFCSFNNNFKITEDVYSAWMRILQGVPDSVLWLVSDHEVVRRNLWNYAAKQGIAKERIIFAERAVPAEYLARYQLADLFLDTWPFNAGTTASDALWAGIPLLTYSGECFSARMAGSLLRAIGLPELITFSSEDYISKAIMLGRDRHALATLRQHVQTHRLECELFDSVGFVKKLEDAYFSVAVNFAPPAQTRQPAPASPVHLYHIAYDEKTRASMPPGYQMLDNLTDNRHDWREYWPIRKFLLTQKLDENSFYGFFSPRFAEKTGLSHAQVSTFVQDGAGQGADVMTFSPQPDMGAFFLNVFEQEDLFQPGFLAAAEAFLATIGRAVPLASLVMDSRQVVFSNYFVARPAFWREWLEVNEALFSLCEQADADDPVRRALTAETSYPGAVQRKVFLMERIASLLLTIQPAWRVRAYSTFDCAWSGTKLNQFRLEAVLSDALKIAMKEQGFHQYHEAFATLRDKLR